MKLKKNIALSDTGFIFNPNTGDSYSTNPIGLEIVKMLKDEKSVNDIKNFVLKNYQVDEAGFDKDFYDFSKMIEGYKLTE